MLVRWQDIVKASHPKRMTLNHCKRTVENYYIALIGAIDVECDLTIPDIGKIKGTRKGPRRLLVIKKHNIRKTRYKERTRKRRQRLWLKKKFDDFWPE